MTAKKNPLGQTDEVECLMAFTERASLDSATPAPVLVPLTLVDAHPDNPRFSFDQTTVDALAADMCGAGRFDPTHAIIVRRCAGRLQVVSGHQRTEAARRAGLTEIWGWVVDWDDKRTLIELALSNRHTPIPTLWLAIHSFKIARAPGKDGRGLSAFAAAMGIKDSNLARYRRGAEVYQAVVAEQPGSYIDIIAACSGRALHFAEMRGAPRAIWSSLLRECVANDWSVRETRRRVRSLLQKPSKPEAQSRSRQSEMDVGPTLRAGANTDATGHLADDAEGKGLDHNSRPHRDDDDIAGSIELASPQPWPEDASPYEPDFAAASVAPSPPELVTPARTKTDDDAFVSRAVYDDLLGKYHMAMATNEHLTQQLRAAQAKLVELFRAEEGISAASEDRADVLALPKIGSDHPQAITPVETALQAKSVSEAPARSGTARGAVNAGSSEPRVDGDRFDEFDAFMYDAGVLGTPCPDARPLSSSPSPSKAPRRTQRKAKTRA